MTDTEPTDDGDANKGEKLIELYETLEQEGVADVGVCGECGDVVPSSQMHDRERRGYT